MNPDAREGGYAYSQEYDMFKIDTEALLQNKDARSYNFATKEYGASPENAKDEKSLFAAELARQNPYYITQFTPEIMASRPDMVDELEVAIIQHCAFLLQETNDVDLVNARYNEFIEILDTKARMQDSQTQEQQTTRGKK